MTYNVAHHSPTHNSATAAATASDAIAMLIVTDHQWRNYGKRGESIASGRKADGGAP